MLACKCQIPGVRYFGIMTLPVLEDRAFLSHIEMHEGKCDLQGGNNSLVQTGSLNSILAKSDHKNLIR